jgi:LysM repeat protein
MLARAARAPAAAPVTRARLASVVLGGHRVAASRGSRRYTVRPGDTLAGIAQRFYGQAGDWHLLYRVNRPEIRDPNLIYAGQVLRIPRSPHHRRPDGDHDTDDGYQPRHAQPASEAGAGSSSGSGSGSSGAAGLSGTLGCGGLEQLWVNAGGAPSAEVVAASVAMAESGGQQYATGPNGERGYWQINPVNGSLSTYDPYGNARAAVILSHDGTDWSAWTTYTSGAYAGRC